MQVQAIYSEDITSAWTPSTTFVTGTTPPTITVDHVTDKSAHIAWTLPGNEEGCTYNLRYATLCSMARVTLTVDFVTRNHTGYQMLLDADATAYGDIIPINGELCDEYVPEGLYDAFEYKFPKNADSNLNTSNIVLNNSVTIDIPAGTYDWCITNPVPTWGIFVTSAN